MPTYIWCLGLPLFVMTTQVLGSPLLRHLNLNPYAPVCIIENGFDFEGNDIKNVPSTPVEGCCQICKDTNDCHAWSWSTYNNGTCWLKSDRGKVLVNPNVKSAYVMYMINPECVVYEDIDLVGNDIGHVANASATSCCDACRNYLGCRAYSWSDYEGGTCWLKSTGVVAVAKKGVKSARAYPPFDHVCTVEYDTDFVGNDIGSKPSASPGSCCDDCFYNPSCRAYSWTNQDGGTCYFKNLAGDKIKKPGVVSSTVKSNPGYSCDVVSGLDYMGSDIANVRSASSDLCCDICTLYAGCKAYTWSDYAGGTCWLKSGTGAVLRNARVLSGVPRRTAP